MLLYDLKGSCFFNLQKVNHVQKFCFLGYRIDYIYEIYCARFSPLDEYISCIISEYIKFLTEILTYKLYQIFL